MYGEELGDCPLCGAYQSLCDCSEQLKRIHKDLLKIKNKIDSEHPRDSKVTILPTPVAPRPKTETEPKRSIFDRIKKWFKR